MRIPRAALMTSLVISWVLAAQRGDTAPPTIQVGVPPHAWFFESIIKDAMRSRVRVDSFQSRVYLHLPASMVFSRTQPPGLSLTPYLDEMNEGALWAGRRRLLFAARDLDGLPNRAFQLAHSAGNETVTMTLRELADHFGVRASRDSPRIDIDLGHVRNEWLGPRDELVPSVAVVEGERWPHPHAGSWGRTSVRGTVAYGPIAGTDVDGLGAGDPFERRLDELSRRVLVTRLKDEVAGAPLAFGAPRGAPPGLSCNPFCDPRWLQWAGARTYDAAGTIARSGAAVLWPSGTVSLARGVASGGVGAVAGVASDWALDRAGVDHYGGRAVASAAAGLTAEGLTLGALGYSTATIATTMIAGAPVMVGVSVGAAATHYYSSSGWAYEELTPFERGGSHWAGWLGRSIVDHLAWFGTY